MAGELATDRLIGLRLVGDETAPAIDAGVKQLGDVFGIEPVIEHNGGRTARSAVHKGDDAVHIADRHAARLRA